MINMKLKRYKKGFTLAELLIVVAIIGILVAVSIPIFTSQLDKSKEATDLANMRSAKAAALAEWMSSGMTEEVEYKYDAAKGVVVTDSTPTGYGKSNHAVEGATGIPNDGTAHYVTVKVLADGSVSMRWGGNDLSTAAGRRQEDIDNMHNIASALKAGFENKNYQFKYNYVQVAVFKDGTMAFYMDHQDDPEKDTAGIKESLTNAGLSIENTTLYSSDSKWANGYLIQYEKDGRVSYKQLSAVDNDEKQIAWNWWNKNNITDEDLVE